MISFEDGPDSGETDDDPDGEDEEFPDQYVDDDQPDD